MLMYIYTLTAVCCCFGWGCWVYTYAHPPCKRLRGRKIALGIKTVLFNCVNLTKITTTKHHCNKERNGRHQPEASNRCVAPSSAIAGLVYSMAFWKACCKSPCGMFRTRRMNLGVLPSSYIYDSKHSSRRFTTGLPKDGTKRTREAIPSMESAAQKTIATLDNFVEKYLKFQQEQAPAASRGKQTTWHLQDTQKSQ